MTTSTPAAAAQQGFPRIVTFLLNVAHGVDHMFLLIFATAVIAIAHEFGYSSWEDHMPYGAHVNRVDVDRRLCHDQGHIP